MAKTSTRLPRAVMTETMKFTNGCQDGFDGILGIQHMAEGDAQVMAASTPTTTSTIRSTSMKMGYRRGPIR